MKNNYKILSYLNTRSLFMGIGLSSILIDTKEYFFLSIIIGTILGLLILKLNKNNNKIVNIISNSILFIISFIILINMISTMYLTKMPRFLIGLPILLIVFYLLNKNLKTIYNIAFIFLLIHILLYLFSSLSLIKHINLNNIIFEKLNIKIILLNSLKYALYSTVPILINKDKNINLTKTYLISSLTMFVWFFLTYSILGKLINIYRYPEYIILKEINLGNFIKNIENLISYMWLIDELMLILTTSINIKKYSKYYYIIIFILFIISIIFGKYYQLIISLYKYLYIILFIIFLFIIKYKKKSN